MDLERIKDALGLGLSRCITQARPFGTGTGCAGTPYKTSSAEDGTSSPKARSPVGEPRRGVQNLCAVAAWMSYPYAAAFAGPDYWRMDGTCNHCGSLSPDQFFQAIEDGCEIGPTDKNYKVYIEGEKAPNARGVDKFYFQHLSEDKQKHFIELLNLGKIKIGYPGHFYVKPFFVKHSGRTALDPIRRSNVKGTDILTLANGGPRWNIFVLVLLVSFWLIGEYFALGRFETHVDEAIQGVTADVKELKAEVTGIRDDLREDTRHINERIDRSDNQHGEEMILKNFAVIAAILLLGFVPSQIGRLLLEHGGWIGQTFGHHGADLDAVSGKFLIVGGSAFGCGFFSTAFGSMVYNF